MESVILNGVSSSYGKGEKGGETMETYIGIVSSSSFFLFRGTRRDKKSSRLQQPHSIL